MNLCRNPLCIKRNGQPVKLSATLISDKDIINKYEWAEEYSCLQCNCKFYQCNICPKRLTFVKQELWRHMSWHRNKTLMKKEKAAAKKRKLEEFVEKSDIQHPNAHQTNPTRLNVTLSKQKTSDSTMDVSVKGKRTSTTIETSTTAITKNDNNKNEFVTEKFKVS